MAYLGKEFVLSSQENYEEFINSLSSDDISDDVKKAVLNHKGTIKLVKNGNQYTLTTSQPGGSMKVVTFTSGVPFDDELNGHKAKTTITVNGDELTTVMSFAKGTMTVTRLFSDNQIVSTTRSTDFNGVAKRIYKA